MFINIPIIHRDLPYIGTNIGIGQYMLFTNDVVIFGTFRAVQTFFFFYLNHSRVCFLWNGRNWMWGQYLNVNTVSSCGCVHFTAQIEHLANSPPLSHLVTIENSLVVQSRCPASHLLWVSCLDFLKTPQHFDFHLACSHAVERSFSAGTKAALVLEEPTATVS